jgi:3-phenylpropionate/cinnamic acid dioxygenase small subunit
MPVSAPVYIDIQQFLVCEALLLDYARYEEWSILLDREICYRVRNLSGRETPGAEYTTRNCNSLLWRIGPSNSVGTLFVSRRTVTNIHVSFGESPKVYDVVSQVRVRSISPNGGTNSVWCGERRDRIRGCEHSWKITSREVTIDSIELGSNEPPPFL